jgi:PKD repeat protein
MHTPILRQVYLVAGALTLAGAAAAAEVTATPAHAVMAFSYQDMVAHKARRVALPRRESATAPKAAMDMLSAPAASTSTLSLLPHLAYTPSQWNQGGCGDCWVWGSTAVSAIDYGVHTGTPACFSVQYLNSTYNGGSGNGWACCGGDPALFANFYQSNRDFIPWSNAAAGYTDLNSYCGGTSATRAAAIARTPNIPFSAISDQVIVTTGVTQAQAIANIKAVLNGGEAVAFCYFLPGAGWNDFEQFWSSAAESTVWPDVDKFSGSSFDGGAGGHVTCLVGYDDADGSWILLNSWGPTSGRPDVTFKIPQAMGYNDYMLYGGSEMDQYEFDAFTITWPGSVNTVTAAITAPAPGTTLASGAAATFTGTGTDSTSQASLTYAWAFGDGGTATGPSATHTYSNTGTTTLTEAVTLTANDGTGAKGTGSLTVFVAPVPRNTLTAAITSPAASVTVASGAAVSFAGSATDSSKTATLACAWSFGDGATAATAAASHAYTNTGTTSVTETATFTVKDSTGISAQATRSVTVLPAPRNTVTAAITSPAASVTVASGAAVNFAGSATDSSKAATLAYAWAFGDGTTAATAAASHAYTNNGTTSLTETATFTVKDSTGISAQASRTVIVTPAPRNSLTVAITNPPLVAGVGNGTVVPFACAATDSSRTATLTYTWNFGDGTTGTGPSPSHKFTCSGGSPALDNVVLHVTDNSGATASASTLVYVMPQAGNVVNVAVTSPSGPITIPSGTTQSFTCKGADSSSSAKLTYYWNFGDNICATGAAVSHTYSNTTGAPVTLMLAVLAMDSTGSYGENVLPVTISPAAARR